MTFGKRAIRAAPRTLALLLAIASLLFAAGVADAATATFEPCAYDAPVSSNAWSGSTHPSNRWFVSSYCPMLAELRAIPYAPGQSTASYWNYPDSGKLPTPITSMSFSLSGSDGSETSMRQGVRACRTSDNVCGPIISPSGPDVVTPEAKTISVTSGEIPVGADRVRIDGWCLSSGGCQAARPMQVRDLKVHTEDNDPPWVEHAEPDFGDNNPPPLSFEGWNPGMPRTLYLMLRDIGSGVLYADVRLLGRWAAFDLFTCGERFHTTVAYRCSTAQRLTRVDNFVNAVSFWGLARGVNQLEVHAFDAAGNESEPFIADWWLDPYAPTFTDLRVATAGPNGWQNTLNVDLVWTLTSETVETLQDSGVKSVRYDIESPDGVLDPPAQTVELEELEAIRGIQMPGAGRYRISVELIDLAGNVSAKRDAYVGIDEEIPAAPTLNALPTLGATELQVGRELTWIPPANVDYLPSSLCGYALAIDTSPTTDPGDTANLAGHLASYPLPTLLPDGVNYVHLRAITCAGSVGEIAHMSFTVDAGAPTIVASAPGGGGWYTNDHPLRLTAVDPNGGSLETRLEIPGDSPGDWNAQAVVSPELPDGEHELVFSARDQVGNTATLAMTARVDHNAPDVLLKPRDPDSPTVVRARATDAGSGIANANLQLRGQDGSWQQLAGSLRVLDESRSAAEIVARIPDLGLAPGRYDVRVAATDAAGHSVVGSATESGATAYVDLPLRGASALTAGFREVIVKRACKTSRKRRICRNSKTRSVNANVESVVVSYGQSDTAEGRLIGSAGAGLAGRTIEVTEEITGNGPRSAGSAMTDADGRFKFRPDAGPSRRIVFSYDGSERDAPSKTSARLLVRSAVRFSISRRNIRRGNSVRFSGRVLSAGAEIPRSGLAIEIEYKVGSDWRLFPIRVVASQNGRFSASYVFGRKGGAVRYRFRARARWAEGWAYEAGTSSSKDLVVR